MRDELQHLYEESEKGDDLAVDAVSISDQLLETTEHEMLLHGDIHHYNIVYSSRGWLAIDPCGIRGDPCYEFANLYGNPKEMPDFFLSADRINGIAQTVSERTGLDRVRLLKFAFIYNTVSSIWSDDDPQHRKNRRTVAQLIRQQL